MIRVPWNLLLAVLLIGTFTACEDPSFSDDEIDYGNESAAASSDSAPTTGNSSNGDVSDTGASGTASDGIDLSKVTWLDTNVSGWEQTSTLSVSISGAAIELNYDKAKVWPAGSVDGTSLNANPWVIVEIDGTWYAATFEWLRPGQTSKPKFTVDGSHINSAPLSSWHPKSGETYGFLVSGLARSSTRNIRERTQVVMVTWP